MNNYPNNYPQKYKPAAAPPFPPRPGYATTWPLSSYVWLKAEHELRGTAAVWRIASGCKLCCGSMRSSRANSFQTVSAEPRPHTYKASHSESVHLVGHRRRLLGERASLPTPPPPMLEVQRYFSFARSVQLCKGLQHWRGGG